MTTTELAKKLLELASNATPGERYAVGPEPGVNGPVNITLYRTHVYRGDIAVIYTNLNGCTGNPEFIATANPENIARICERLIRYQEALERTAKTDICSTTPDLLWLNNWRNDCKTAVKEALAETEE